MSTSQAARIAAPVVPDGRYAMIRVTVHRKFSDGTPSLAVSPRRGFKTFENAANSAMRLLADER
jgi:hypothetical protein